MTDEIDVIHYWWRTGRLVACDSLSPRGTTIIDEVTCDECRVVIDRAEILSVECGCRSVQVHAPMAAVQRRLGTLP